MPDASGTMFWVHVASGCAIFNKAEMYVKQHPFDQNEHKPAAMLHPDIVPSSLVQFFGCNKGGNTKDTALDVMPSSSNNDNSSSNTGDSDMQDINIAASNNKADAAVAIIQLCQESNSNNTNKSK